MSQWREELAKRGPELSGPRAAVVTELDTPATALAPWPLPLAQVVYGLGLDG